MVLLGWWKLSNGVEAEAVSCGRAADGSELVGGSPRVQACEVPDDDDDEATDCRAGPRAPLEHP